MEKWREWENQCEKEACKKWKTDTLEEMTKVKSYGGKRDKKKKQTVWRNEWEGKTNIWKKEKLCKRKIEDRIFVKRVWTKKSVVDWSVRRMETLLSENGMKERLNQKKMNETSRWRDE